MKGEVKTIFNFMSIDVLFRIPCYQRPYSWSQKQCDTLYEDMINLHQQQQVLHSDKVTHFIGSVVCQKIDGDKPTFLIIDGQQRLITIYLFYLALYRVALERPESVGLAYLCQFNLLSAQKGNSDLEKPRFTLTKADQNALDQLFVGNKNEFIDEASITVAYKFFVDRIKQETALSLNDLLNITKSLVFIKIELEELDSAQRIFESLNSKGQDLAEGDKIRNFILMDFNDNKSEAYYHDLWFYIEQNCFDIEDKDKLSKFIQDYLAIKRGRAPSMESLYFEFKDFVLRKFDEESKAGRISLNDVKVEIMQELLAYSKLFARISSCSYELFKDRDTSLSANKRIDLQKNIEQCLWGLKNLDHSTQNHMVHTSFTMQCMFLHQSGAISGDELWRTLKLLETFLMRRWVCGVVSQGLNRWFQALHNAIKRVQSNEDFVSKLESLICPDGNAILPNSMPSDAEFRRCLHDRPLYKKDHGQFKSSLFYLLERLENAGSHEKVKIYEELKQKPDAFSIEHIMPQNIDKWKNESDPELDKIYKTWLHRLANLTLTAAAYNSKLSNSPFAEKCNMEDGFASSPLRLNQAIAKNSHWGAKELEQRAEKLIEKALKIWPYPRKEGASQHVPQSNTPDTDVIRSAAQTVSTKTQVTNIASQDTAADAILTSTNLELQQQSFVNEGTVQVVRTQKDNAAVTDDVQFQQNDVFDYCLAEEQRDLSGTRLAGCEFLGQHYDVKKWAHLQRMLLTQIYQRNPERLRSWLAEKWGKFNLLAQLVTPEPNVTVARSDLFEIDKGIYLNSHQPVYDKVKMLKQLFELMEIDPKELTLHIVKMRNKD